MQLSPSKTVTRSLRATDMRLTYHNPRRSAALVAIYPSTKTPATRSTMGCPHRFPKNQSRNVICRQGRAWRPLYKFPQIHPHPPHDHRNGTSIATYNNANWHQHIPQSCQHIYRPTADQSHGHAFPLADIPKSATTISPLLATWANQQYWLSN